MQRKQKNSYIRGESKKQKKQYNGIVGGYSLMLLLGVIILVVQLTEGTKNQVNGTQEITIEEKEYSPNNKEQIINVRNTNGKIEGEQRADNVGEVIGVDNDVCKPSIQRHKQKNAPVQVRGIYLTAISAGSVKKMDKIIKLMNETELNTVIIDVKDDLGLISYNMEYEKARQAGATTDTIKDIHTTIKRLKDNNVYVIGRVVVFKDPIMGNYNPGSCLKKKDGSIFLDNSGSPWLNPYEKENWDYIVTIAKRAVEVGFDEIQLDYVRFSTDPGIKQVDYGPKAGNMSKAEIITQFVKYVCDRIQPLGAYVSADVYGAVIGSDTDANIVGQDYQELSKYLDYISPMIYPSHYGNGYYGLKVPDLQPYELVHKALKTSVKVLGNIDGNQHRAIVRPWLQDFTAKWLKTYQVYEEKQVREQIQAVYDAGYQQWMLWNSGNSYTKDALIKTKEDVNVLVETR